MCSKHYDLGLEVGAQVSRSALDRLASVLAECLLEAATGKPPSTLTAALMLTEPLNFDDPIDVVLFSGGVSEYFYQETTDHFGDLGALLADARCVSGDP